MDAMDGGRGGEIKEGTTERWRPGLFGDGKIGGGVSFEWRAIHVCVIREWIVSKAAGVL